MENTLNRCQERFLRYRSALQRLSEAILEYEEATDETEIMTKQLFSEQQ